ncbi:MAG: hypothetical protein AAF687_05655 [Pseudomonadota bacterium]
MFSTIVFVLFCAVAALIVWAHRADRRSDAWLNPSTMVWIWPVALAACSYALLSDGERLGFGKQLTLNVEELRLPVAEAPSDGTQFIVGPSAETSDLVIGPYADPTRSEEAYREEFEELLTLRRQGDQWELCGKTVPPPEAAEANLPGMQVLFDDEPVQGEACRALSSAPVKAKVRRLDQNNNKQTRRNLTISLEPGFVRIALQSDERFTSRLGRCPEAGAANKKPFNDRLRIAPVGLHERDLGYRVPDNLTFVQLGQGGDNPFLAPEKLGLVSNIDELCDGFRHEVRWPTPDIGTRLIMTSSTVAIAWWAVILMTFSAVVTTRACRNQWQGRRGRTEAAVVIALQWLLALRLLIAMAGFPNDPGLTLANVLWPPAAAFVCVPVIAVALLRGFHEKIGLSLGILLAQVPIAYAFIAWQLDWQLPGMQEWGLAVIALILVALRVFTSNTQPLLYLILVGGGDKAFQFGRKLLGWINSALGFLSLRISERQRLKRAWDGVGRAASSVHGQVLRPLEEESEDGATSLFVLGLLLATTLVVIRNAFAAVGKLASPPIWQERFTGLPGIENLPISLVYAPLAIIAMALMISGYRKLPTVLKAVLLVIAFCALFLGTAIFVRDLGIILIFALPVALVLAKLASLRTSGAAPLDFAARGALIFPLFSPLLLLGGYYAFYAQPVPAPLEDLEGHMAASVEWDANLVRLQRFWDADPLIDVGNTSAFEVLDQAAQLEPLTNQYIGEGYMMPSGIVAPVLGYQYSDNLLAAHVAWPFGRVGLLALLAGMLVVVLAFRPTPVEQARPTWLHDASYLAAATLFWSGAYMALANLNLMPFTGRNFYFLAARSMGDLAEGLVLILIVALAGMAVRTEEASEEGAEQ